MTNNEELSPENAIFSSHGVEMCGSAPLSTNEYDDLYEATWIQVPKSPYVLKFVAEDNSYKILITDLNKIYGDACDSSEVSCRFKKFNPYAVMKTDIVIKYVKEVLKALKRKEFHYEEHIELKCEENHLSMKIKFINSPFSFEIKAQLLPSEQLRTHVLAPILFKCSMKANSNSAHSSSNKALNAYDGFKKKSKVTEIELTREFMNFQKWETPALTDIERYNLPTVKLEAVSNEEHHSERNVTNSKRNTRGQKRSPAVKKEVIYDGELSTDVSNSKRNNEGQFTSLDVPSTVTQEPILDEEHSNAVTKNCVENGERKSVKEEIDSTELCSNTITTNSESGSTGQPKKKKKTFRV